MPEALRDRGRVLSLGAQQGLWAGLAGALVLAYQDYASVAGWLEVADRPALAWRVAATLCLFGAQFGALFGAAFAHLRASSRSGASRLWDASPLALIASPILLWAAFTVARAPSVARRIPSLPLGLGLALGGGLALAALAAPLSAGFTALVRGRRRWPKALFGALLLGLAVGLVKLDQLAYPRLYEGLHAALSFSAWAAASGGAWLLARAGRRASSKVPLSSKARLSALASAALGLLVVALGLAGLLGLPEVPNLHAWLRDPRAPSCRSALFALSPVLRLAWSRRQEQAPPPRSRPRRGAREEGPVRPGHHLLLVTIDALRADHLGAYGGRREGISPRIDALAAEGQLFERAYASAPHSSYSISALMSGQDVRELGPRREPDPPTLASLLGERGYYTAAFYTEGIFYFEPEQVADFREGHFGFVRHEHRNSAADQRSELVLEEADRILEQGEPPSFLWVHYFDVHHPYEARTYGERPVDRYDSEIRRVDEALGALLDGLRARLSRPIVVALSADHGEEFGDHGGRYHASSVYEEQVRVPLILSVPELAARRIEAPVELVDLAPTLLALLDVAPAEAMVGDDLRPLLLAEREGISGPVFASVGSRRMVVEGSLKGIFDAELGTVEVYDLSRDPRERHNLARERAADRERLRSLLRGWPQR